MLVVVADSEQEYGEVIGELLRRQSHRVVLAANAESFWRFLDRSTVDLIIMSASIADAPPAELVREIHRQQPVPVIVLFDHSGPAEAAACFDAGAEDCIRKPFHPSEFVARVEAVARRAANSTGGDPSSKPVTSIRSVPSEPTGQGLEFDSASNRVFYQGTDINCSQLEYQILFTLAAGGGQVLTYAVLNERVWGYPNLSDGTLLKGRISSIRAKLREAGFEDNVIRTVYGVGYALATAPAEQALAGSDLRALSA